MDPLEIIDGKGSIKNISRNFTKHSYLADVQTQTRFRENTLYFPGWEVLVDGKKVPIEFQDQLKNLLDSKGGVKRIPQLVRYSRRVVQLNQEPFFVGPCRVGRVASESCAYLLGIQFRAISKKGDMYSPFIRAATARAPGEGRTTHCQTRWPTPAAVGR